jgi:pyruvate dehydrogenase E2 component (dihydrolipoamide acetyltransferase)
MSIEVLLPQRGMGMNEATISEWLVKTGQTVKQGDPIVRIETSKVTEDIIAPAGGVILKILFDEGDTVEVGNAMCLIGEPGDVSTSSVPSKPSSTTIEESNSKNSKVLPFNSLQRTTSKHVLESLQNTAQVTLHVEVDLTETVKRHDALKTSGNLTYTDILIKVVCGALKQHPLLNARWTEEGILLQSDVHMGIAMALEEGLVVPVVHFVEQKTLDQIHAEILELTEKARKGALTPGDIEGGTFTISNLGKYRITFFTPIINSPETAILGVGRIIQKPAIIDGKVESRSMMGLSLTFDHRLVDGAPAAAFLDEVCEILEVAGF